MAESLAEAGRRSAEPARRLTWLDWIPAAPVALGLLGLHLALALLFVLSRASGTDSALVGLPLDDAWIHLVYARSLADRLAFCYNPGQLEAGMTSPLFCLLAAPLLKAMLLLGAAPPLATKLLGVVFAWATSLVLYSAGRRWTGSTWAAWGAAILPALEPNLGFARVSGMEVWLSAWVLLLSLLHASDRRWLAAGIVAGLGLWTRPENAIWALFLPLAFVFAAWFPRRSAAMRLRELARYLAPVALAALLFIVYCLIVTGRPLPNTFYAKYSPVPGFDLRPWIDGMWVHYVRSPALMRSGGGLALLALAGIWLRDRRGVLLAAIAYPVLLALAQSRNYYFYTPSASFAFDRYYQPALLLWLALAGVSAGLSLERIRSRPSLYTWIGMVALAASLVAIPGRMASRVWLYSWNTRNIEDLQVRAGRWLDQAAKGSVSAVALNDAGAMRFVGKLPAVDLAGLNTHELAGVDGLPASTWQLLEARGVEWIAVLPAWYPQFAQIPGLELAQEIRAPHYTLKQNAGWDRMVIYRAPGGFRASMAAPLFVQRGEQLEERGAWDLALEQYEEAARSAPGDTLVERRLARARGTRTRAEAELRGLSGATPGAKANASGAARASDLSYRLGHKDESAKLFETAYAGAADPNTRLLMSTQRAQLLAQHRAGPEALQLLERASRRDPGQPALLLQLGRLALAGQRYRLAERSFRRALSAGSDVQVRTLSALGLVELAVQTGDRALGAEATLALGGAGIDPSARERAEEMLRSLTPLEHDWD